MEYADDQVYSSLCVPKNCLGMRLLASSGALTQWTQVVKVHWDIQVFCIVNKIPDLVHQLVDIYLIFWFSLCTVLEHHIVIPSERREHQQEMTESVVSRNEGPSWPPLDLEAAILLLVEERVASEQVFCTDPLLLLLALSLLDIKWKANDSPNGILE